MKVMMTSSRESKLMGTILSVVLGLILIDIVGDFQEGAASWHLAIEVIAAFLALIGLYFLINNFLVNRKKLRDSIEDNDTLRKESIAWKAEAQKYVEGLSLSIDKQLEKWNLSFSEKEVALLILKGLSSKEIAVIRNTSEKTVRVQSSAIYSKAGLAGRSELAAFFLEDLLQPQKIESYKGE